MTGSTGLPQWDMTVIFPALDSSEYAQAFAHFGDELEQLEALFKATAMGAHESNPLKDTITGSFERVIAGLNAALQEHRTLGAYINAFVTTNSRDDLAQAKQSELQRQSVRLAQLSTRFTAWIGSLDVEALLARSPIAEAHSFMLRRAKQAAEHLMSPDEEALAAELNVTGGGAWAKLHGNVTSQLRVPVEMDGQMRELPMSIVRNLAYDPDREVRHHAYKAELAGWERVGMPLAAAMNSIKGEGNTLAARRHWESPLDAALFEANIDRQTLDAMFEAARATFPAFRRYLHAKARLLGLPVLAWYDLFAPVSGTARAWSFDEGSAFIIEQFGSFSPRMADLAARAFRERWIDAEPRDGKRDGAYCMAVRGDESRVFANFKSAFPGVSTLAHELGHGYHNLNLARRTMLQRQTPMTLAETASIFCETIIRNAALEQGDAGENLEILEASLQGSCQVVVDIMSRFLFEQRTFERRRQRELSVAELNETMLTAQRETYGDGLDHQALHAYMWAMKPHYYSTGRPFYNFPYMFGLLFGLGLYAHYQRDPEGFHARYDELLASTGMADAATLAARFGINTRDSAFWDSSLDMVRLDIARFEELANTTRAVQ